MKAPDRSQDVQPPSNGTLRECKCGKRAIVRVDATNRHQGYLTWNWWCGCGHVEGGGRWHPLTAEEASLEVWERANAQADEAAKSASAVPGRIIPPDCQHENKTVADGGWTCDDCGRVGTIATLSDHMRAMPPQIRRAWCDDLGTDAQMCPGDGCICANGAGKLAFWGFTKERWEKWCSENPTAAEILADVETVAAADPEANGEKLFAAALEKRPGLQNVDVLRLAVHAFVTARGTQESAELFA